MAKAQRRHVTAIASVIAISGLFCVATAAWSDPATQPLTVTYSVTFDATWSEATHPDGFPPNPHFSGLIGGNHSAAVSFWDVGEQASLGIQRMAEWGATTYLADEVDAAITAGTAEAVISNGGIPSSPGSVSHSFTVSQDYPLVTLVSMIAPSPDWFIGVSGLNLFEGGAWAYQVVVVLWPYDAGTDSGVSYGSPNQPTVPHEPIAQITSGPLGNGVPLGTFTFTLDDPPTAVPAAEALQAWTYPNPFNPRTTIRYYMPEAGRLSVAVYDLKGQLVRLLLNLKIDQGDGVIPWDGTDRRGSSVAAGTYIVRLSALNQNSVQKITLAK